MSTLYRDAALTDARSGRLRLGASVLVTDGWIAWIRPSDDEGEPPPGCEIVDAGGTTIVPGMVDGLAQLDGADFVKLYLARGARGDG